MTLLSSGTTNLINYLSVMIQVTNGMEPQNLKQPKPGSNNRPKRTSGKLHPLMLMALTLMTSYLDTFCHFCILWPFAETLTWLTILNDFIQWKTYFHSLLHLSLVLKCWSSAFPTSWCKFQPSRLLPVTDKFGGPLVTAICGLEIFGEVLSANQWDVVSKSEPSFPPFFLLTTVVSHSPDHRNCSISQNSSRI